MVMRVIDRYAMRAGVEAVDKSAVESKGEVRLVVAAATAKPEKLKDRLHRVTGKKVDLLVIAPPKPAAAADDDDKAAAAEAVAALIRQAQAQAGVHVVRARGQAAARWRTRRGECSRCSSRRAAGTTTRRRLTLQAAWSTPTRRRIHLPVSSCSAMAAAWCRHGTLMATSLVH